MVVSRDAKEIQNEVLFDIHHVILLQVIDRRGIEVVGGTKVNAIDTLLAVLVTQHQDFLAFTIYGQVTGLAQGVEDGEVILVDIVTSGTVHLTHDIHAQVHELNRDYGILDEVVRL